VESRPKKKKISPIDKRRDTKRNKGSGEGDSYADVCRIRPMRADTLEQGSCESGEWVIKRRRRDVRADKRRLETGSGNTRPPPPSTKSSSGPTS
jgi:hypothetical protein